MIGEGVKHIRRSVHCLSSIGSACFVRITDEGPASNDLGALASGPRPCLTNNAHSNDKSAVWIGSRIENYVAGIFGMSQIRSAIYHEC